MAHQVLARKWRPHSFDTVVGQTHVVKALTNALTHNQLHQAYLFSGTRGVGKTSIARIFAKCLNCEAGVSATPCNNCNACQEIDAGRFPDLYEVDAASRTKVEDTRELLDNVQYAPVKGRFKIYLIDEVHMLSGHSFNALLKTLEEPPAHVKFLLATTDPQRLPATVLSRCLQFHLLQMPPEQIAEHLQTILKAEKVECEPQATFLIGKAAQGSMRDALSLLDQSIAFGNGKVMLKETSEMLGTIDSSTLYTLINAIHTQDANAVLASAATLNDQGIDFKQALADLLSILHDVAKLQLAPNTQNETTAPELIKLAQTLTPEDVQLYYQIGIVSQRDLPFAPSPRSGFEMALLRMMSFTPQAATTQTHPATKTASAPKSTRTQQTQAPTPAPPQATTASPQNAALAKNWNELLTQLNLVAPTLAVAQQCSMTSLDDETLKLTLHPKKKPLMNQRHIDRIQEALQRHSGKSIKVSIDFAESSADTPAKIIERDKQEKQAHAEKRIKEDTTVQRIMKTFDASVVDNSIIPNEEH